MTKRLNKIEKLIAELCPEGVEYSKIEDLCEVSRGRVISKGYLRDNAGAYPVYSSQTTNQGVFGRIASYDYDGEYVTWTTDGAHAGSVFYRNGKFSITNICGLLKPKGDDLLTKYLYHILSIRAKEHVNAGMGNPKLMSNIVKAIKIPVPPLPVQEEIVRVLDTFTALEAELEAELEARRQQYTYYRDQLLDTVNFNEDTEVRSLKDITVSTESIKWNKASGINYQYIDLSSVDRDTNSITETVSINAENAPSRAQKVVYENDIVFATTRPTLKRYTIITDKYDGQIVSTGYCVLRASKEVLPKWIYYNIAKSEFNDFVEKNQRGASYPAISDSKVKQFQIPIPPLPEQRRIVAVLDKFDALVNDISVGLPAELAARRQQYAHYRDRLLSFPERQKVG